MFSHPARAFLLLLFGWAFAPPGFSQQQISLVPITNSWRYNLSGLDLSGQFQQTGYDDSGWPAGAGLLGYEMTIPFPYPDPILTEFPYGSSYRITLYFRTHFHFPSNTAEV